MARRPDRPRWLPTADGAGGGPGLLDRVDRITEGRHCRSPTHAPFFNKSERRLLIV